MKYCHYTLKLGNRDIDFTSYSDLFNFLDDYFNKSKNAKKLGTITDIVFSKNANQKTIVQQLKDKQLEGKYFGTIQSVVDGEPTFFDNSKVTISKFLDMEQCNINNRRLVTSYNVEDYKKYAIEDLQNKGYSEQDATNIINEEVQSWEFLKEDAKFVHKLANSNIFNIKDDATFLNTIKDDVPDSLKEVAISLKDQLQHSWKMAQGATPNQEFFKGLNIKAKLKNFDEDIFGHIDWLFVGEDGTLHLYVIKTSTQNSKDWVRVKRDKYKYQLAFLEQMLKYNNIPTKNIELNILPIKLTYEGNEVKKVYIQNTEHYSTLSNSPEFAMHKYAKAAQFFIQDNSISYHITAKPLKRALEVNTAIFPSVNLKEDGLGQSALSWIMYAPSENINGTEPLVIRKVKEKDRAYEVILNDKTYNIKSDKEKSRNKEIINLVTEHLKELEDQKGYAVQRLKEAITNSYDKGFMTFSSVNGLKGNSIQLEAVLGKYLNDFQEDQDGNRKYKWELLDDLIDANILIFKNKEDNTLDFITLSTFDPNVTASKAQGKSFILWNYLMDSDQNSVTLKADYGNIEAVRTMELINEILPNLGTGVKLGTVGVLGAINNASYRSFNISEFNKNYFSKIIQIVNRENPDLKIINNFKDAKFTDPIEDIVKEFIRITKGKPVQYTKDYDQLGFGELSIDDDVLTQINALENILLRIQSSGWANFTNPEYLEKVLQQSGESKSKNIAKLYELVAKAYLQLRGETPSYNTSFSGFSSKFMTATTVDSDNIRIIVNNLQITYDTISEEFIKEYDQNIPRIFGKFYEKCGYSAAQNMLIGNQASQYKNCFNTEDDLFSFKNPYDNNNDLKPHEREMLKQTLFYIDKINRNGNSQFTSPNDTKIPQYIKAHPEYLWVPLERASQSTKRQSKEAIVAGMKNFIRTVKNASTAFDEFVQGITPEEMELYKKDSDSFYRMHVKNPFSLSIPSSGTTVSEVEKSRRDYLNKYGKAFFETNIENICIDFLAKHISTTQYNKLLVASKALLLELHITGNYGGNKDVVGKEIKYIQDYLKVNALNTSIMSEEEKKVVGVLSPLKRFVTHLLIGGNIIGALRDIFEGAQHNFIRSVIKLHTDINPDEVAKAYNYVFTHSSSNAFAQNLLNKLCLKYRISNTDVGRISERAKTDRTGILNVENIMYSTLRCPDFLNRMTLFVAKCMHDGVWDAFSLNNNGQLIYDWTKDKRFSALKTAPKDSEEYNKALSLYYSRIKEYNEEHPNNPIEKPDNDWPSLPEPYSRRYISSIRALGDNIYGSYDKSKKGMAEHAAYGFLFGSFSTWMNGIVNNYFMSTQKNSISQLKGEQDTNDQGEKLYFTKDFQITTENTGIPVIKDVPIIIQGILPTIGEMYTLFKNDGWDATWEYIKGNNMVKSNIYKLTSDALMWALFAALFGFIFSPAYKEHKKQAKDNPLLVNMIAELLYKSSSRAYSQYAGPINVIQFFGENMNPPYYTAPVQWINEGMQALVGDKSWKYIIFDGTGLTRSFKDSAFAYIKSNQE